ncbi:hypothetical protein [Paenibacillus sp. Marseille-Q4541]|uniref:hypothetical protein n=1 Tax=Paenibacillus sp. Marseille-Q4541 TaxID=2831522 RepID=UPI001BAD1F34|nr:hypothetical protein [Paenibacillus sp. Marseille-Q4541]
MNEETLKVHMDYRDLENNLYFKLEEALGTDKADELLDVFIDYREQYLKVGKYLDEESYIGKNGFLKEEYEGFERYLRVEIVYNYDDGFSLCESTTGLFKLVPTNLISFEVE